MIRKALEACGGNRAEAARRLNIHRQLLYTKMQRYGLAGPRTSAKPTSPSEKPTTERRAGFRKNAFYFNCSSLARRLPTVNSEQTMRGTALVCRRPMQSDQEKTWQSLFIKSDEVQNADHRQRLRNAAGAAPCADNNTAAPASVPWDQQVDVTGTVKAFMLTPIGEIEGMILTNGTEIHVPPHLTEQVASAVRLGEAVAVRGWNVGVPNFHRRYGVDGPTRPERRRPRSAASRSATTSPAARTTRAGAQMATVQGRILQVLHGPRGDVNGAILDDGTTLKFPPPSAWQMSSLLQPGQSVVAQGWSLSNSYGRVVDVQSITSAQQAAPPPAGTSTALPPPPPPPAWRRRHHRPPPPRG